MNPNIEQLKQAYVNNYKFLYEQFKKPYDEKKILERFDKIIEYAKIRAKTNPIDITKSPKYVNY